MQLTTCQNFQDTVADFTMRHKSTLDILTKIQESCARVNRAVAKAVTNCGCIEIKAEKQSFLISASPLELKAMLSSHLYGRLCENCKDTIEAEMGKLLFYLTALCNNLDLSLNEVIAKENNKVSLLRLFNLT